MVSGHRANAWTPIVGGFPSDRGSENGVVRLDEEHALGARLTLEEGSTHAPWSITCGLYGWMFHTIFCSTEAEARSKAAAMMDRLGALAMMANGETPATSEEVCTAIQRFVEDFP
jgi:hypothetical protein